MGDDMMIDKNTPLGTEVICIKQPDVSPLWVSSHPIELPKVGLLYTIREIDICSLNKGFIVIRLNEIPDSFATLNGKEYRLAFDVTCFRLIDKQVYEMEKGVKIPSLEDTNRERELLTEIIRREKERRLNERW
jgi:hypothetical protein